MFFLFYFTIVLLALGIQKNQKTTLLNIVVFLLLFGIIGFVSYTPDWDGYELIYSNSISKEFLFNLIVDFFSRLGMKYTFVHVFYSFVITLLYVVFITKNNKNILLIVLLHLPVLFLYQVTQIRFYTAYYIFCFAMYYFFYSKNKVGILFLVLSLLSHTSIVFALPFIFLLKESKKIRLKMYVFMNLFLLFFWMIGDFFIGHFFGKESSYFTYLGEDLNSSFLGAFFRFFPFIMLQTVIYKVVKENDYVLEYKPFMFLYKMSFAPFSLILIMLSSQIMGQRFLISGYLFQIMIIVYFLNNLKGVIRQYYLWFIIIWSLLMIIYIYYLPILFLNDSSVLDNTIKIINSNNFF